MKNKVKGLVLVEVLLAAAFLGTILVPMLNFFLTGAESTWFAVRETRAQALARETIEAVKSVQIRNWPELVVGSYYPEVSDGVWKLTPIDPSSQGEAIGPYNRKVEILPVYRDTGDPNWKIVNQGGTLDASSKKITVTISWHSLRDRVLTNTTYITRYRHNDVWTQTKKVAHFDLGEPQYTENFLDPSNNNTDEGSVQLEGGCGTNPIGAGIYSDSFLNGWDIFVKHKGLNEIKEPPGKVFEGQYALALIAFEGASNKLWNKTKNCTLGFTRLEFRAYSSATVQTGVQSFWLTGSNYNELKWTEVSLQPQTWTLISIPYADVSHGNEAILESIFFKSGVWDGNTKFYLDNITLTGGVGGYYAVGTLASGYQLSAQPFTAGTPTSFNKISFNSYVFGTQPCQTDIGFKVAVCDSPSCTWEYKGPGGTTSDSDLYKTSIGEGIWFGNNYGKYIRYKAYLFSNDGKCTPVLRDVSINYAP